VNLELQKTGKEAAVVRVVSFLSIYETGSRAHPVSRGYCGLFPMGVKQREREADNKAASAFELYLPLPYAFVATYAVSFAVVT
jgi:hypothetical protein